MDESDSLSECSEKTNGEPIIFHVSSCDSSFLESDVEVDEFLREQELDESMESLKDLTGQAYYIYQCKILAIVPCGFYLRHIQDNKLILKHYGLGPVGIKAISNSLMHNKVITHVDFADNWITDDGIPPIMDMIPLNHTITSLNLSFNKLTNKIAFILSETLSNSPILKWLDLSNNLFDDQSALHFGELMILSLRLEYLNLSYNKFHKGCLVPFGKAFLQTTSILHLDLSCNSITGKLNEVNKFVNGLTKNQCFKIIDLSSNGFYNKDFMVAFGKMLKTNTTLQELNLKNNRINTEAIVKLARMLTGCKALKVLRVGRNPILSAGCYSIVNYCIQHSDLPIRTLDFDSCEVNMDFINLTERLYNKVPDIIIITGLQMTKYFFPNIDPIYRLQLFARNKAFKMLDFFASYVNDPENDDFIELDIIPTILDDFCEKNHFQLLEVDKIRIYKSFTRNDQRLVGFSEIAQLFEEEYEGKFTGSQQEEEQKEQQPEKTFNKESDNVEELI